MKTPEYFRTPLRSRLEIADYIFSVTNQRYYDNDAHPFCFDVKLRRLDLSFDHLLKVFKKHNPETEITDEVMERAKQCAEEGDIVYERAVEEAQYHFVGGPKGMPGSDAYRTVFDGREFDVKFSFEGRSGGWLSLNCFEGFDFTKADAEYWRKVLDGEKDEDVEQMDYKTLCNLYAFIVMLKRTTDQAEKEIEYIAASNIFFTVMEAV